MLERNMRELGERIALSDAKRSWTYSSLAALIGHLVEVLKDLGVAPGEPVAVAGPRDARLMALLYGVLGCGNPLLVVSSDWSAGNRANKLRAVGARVLLCTEPAMPGGDAAPDGADDSVPVVDVDSVIATATDTGLRGWQTDADDIVYFAFTSGSSGEPKAVAVAQRNATHYAVSLARRLGFVAGDPPTFAHMTTLAADLGHTSWMLALATGGRAHVVSDHVARDPYALWQELARHQVTCLKTTPSHLAALLPGRPAAAATLDTVLIGGELLSREFASGLFTIGLARRVVNHYGPTETTVGASCFIASRAADFPADESAVPIGTPIGENTLTLDRTAEPADGSGEAIGELVIGGPGVAVGYHGARAEGQSRFRTVGEDRVYHTGDRCRLRPDGNVVFLGRADRQTKINGYRVDLTEVEQVLAQCPGVARATVLSRTVNGQERLVAGVTLATGGIVDDILGSLPERMARRLPRYAIPTPIVPFPQLPVDANGKRDSRRLLDMIEQWLAAESTHATDTTPGADADGLVRELGEFWSSSLGIANIGPDSDVVALGADSILAMRTVVFLKEHGCDIAVTDVYDHPTARRLAEAARHQANGTEPAHDAGVPANRRGALGPPQRWFFDAVAGEAAHWNQAMLLTCKPDLDLAALNAAVGALLNRHEVLRSGISASGASDSMYPTTGMLTVTWSPLADEESAEEAIAGMSAGVNRSLDPASGRLLRCHAFRGGPGVPDRLLLVCHHLVVDTVSWRILLDDLIRLYEAAVEGRAAVFAPSRPYYDWAAAVSGAEEQFDGGSTARSELRDVPVRSEHHAMTYTWAATPDLTRCLTTAFGAGLRLEALTIAAIVRALQTTTGAEPTRVTVETHGRDQCDGAYPNTVGWFTAVKLLAVDQLGDDVGRNVDEVENHVAAAAVHRLDLAERRSTIAVNYLGRFRPPRGRDAEWSFAPEYCGPARASRHDPMYPMVLTARLLDDRFVVDLVCTERALSEGSVQQSFTAFTQEIQRAAGVPHTPALIARAPHTTSGLPTFSGVVPVTRSRQAIVKETPRVLLTGATGFLGAHLLDELVEQGSNVVCLVRPRDGRDVGDRLASTERFEVVECDLALDDPVPERRVLDAFDGVHMVINSAADVRLVAPPAELAKVNIGGVGRLLEWLQSARPGAPLHHVSTLAVAGYQDTGTRRFSEADFDLGQKFLSPYEATKFEAERLVRQASDQGTRCFIYRTNHVAAHSETGVFQSNIADNRVYQTLTGYILTGVAPRSPGTVFAFSHVDTVAAAICRLVLGADVAPDTYHVETPYSVGHDELIGWLRTAGYPVRLVERGEYLNALERLQRTDARNAELSRAWETRPQRNVSFDNARSVAQLRRMGVEFSMPGPAWLRTALTWAAGTGYLGAPAGATDRPVEPRS